jgi:GNAT superfamily N-acetyltransferase
VTVDEIQIAVTDEPAREIYDAILNGLVAYNEEQAGDGGHCPLTVFAKEGERVIGGLAGAIYLKWLYIELFHLPKERRRNGLGTQLIRRAEEEARRRGCIGVHLTTFNFQARGFYEKLGYRAYGTLDDYPPGGARHSMFKRL